MTAAIVWSADEAGQLRIRVNYSVSVNSNVKVRRSGGCVARVVMLTLTLILPQTLELNLNSCKV